MKKIYPIVITAIILLCIFASPVFSSSMDHSAGYMLDGTISFEKQAGHKCNTGAEIKQTIYGEGVMDKEQTVAMVSGKIDMSDENNWVAGDTALTVTTVWDLCCPAKYVFTDAWDDFVQLANATPAVMDLLNDYFSAGTTDQMLSLGSGDPVPPNLGYMLDWMTSIINIMKAYGVDESVIDYLATVLDSPVIAEALTDQIWAVQVAADPGYSGAI